MVQISIILCSGCDGSGHTERYEMVDYHRRDYETIRTPCTRCNGSGRLVKTVETTVAPYIPKAEES